MSVARSWPRSIVARTVRRGCQSVRRAGVDPLRVSRVGATRPRGSASRSRPLPTVRFPSDRVWRRSRSRSPTTSSGWRIDGSAGTTIPANPALGRDGRCASWPASPNTWPTSALRRVENSSTSRTSSVGARRSLGTAGTAPCRRFRSCAGSNGELQFTLRLPPEMQPEGARPCSAIQALPDADALHRRHRVPFGNRRAPPTLDDGVAARREIVSRVSGSFREMTTSTGTTAPYLAFNRSSSTKTKPVVCNQNPPELVLEPGVRAVGTHRSGVRSSTGAGYGTWSMRYRPDGPDAVRRALLESSSVSSPS